MWLSGQFPAPARQRTFSLQFPLTTNEMTLGNELEGRNVSYKGGEALKMAKTEASVSSESARDGDGVP